MALEASDNTQTESSSGIPKAIFVDDVDAFMGNDENKSAEEVLKRLEEQHNKYKFMEYNLTTKKTRLKSQIPDIKTSLDIVQHMKTRKDQSFAVTSTKRFANLTHIFGSQPKENDSAMETTFMLAETLYTKAKVPPTNSVCLWLGANVMLEYTLDDAENLLMKNHNAALKSLSQVDSDLGFIRDQTTTIEVNMARVYNWDVKRRHSEKGTS